MTKDGTDGDGEKWRDLIQNLKEELRKFVELEVESVAKEGINYNFQVSGLRNCVGVVVPFTEIEKLRRKVGVSLGIENLFSYMFTLRCAPGHG